MKTKNTSYAARTARNAACWLIAALACGLAGVASAQTSAGDEILYSVPSTPNKDSYSGAVGGWFTIGGSNVMVSHLGYFCTNTTHPSGLNYVYNNGLQSNHNVGIFPGNNSSLPTILGQVVVPAGISADYSNTFYWAQLNPPLMLLSNTTYYLLAQQWANDGDWNRDQYGPTWNAYFVGSQATTTRSSVYCNGSSTWPPSGSGTAHTSTKNDIYGAPSMGTLVFATDPAYVGVLNTSISIAANSTLNIVGFASGPGPITYQWYTNSVNPAYALSGQTGSTLTIPNATTANSGTYYLTAYNANNSASPSVSAAVTVSITANPVGLTQQPTNLAVFNYYPAAFYTTATGTPPIFCQWSRNGSPVATATATSASTPLTTTYSIPFASLTNNGDLYSCLASNNPGTSYTATTTNATLTVLPNLAQSPEFLIGYHTNLAVNTYAGQQGGLITVGSSNVVVTHLGYYAYPTNCTFSPTTNCTLYYGHHVGIYYNTSYPSGTYVPLSCLQTYVYFPAGTYPVVNGYVWMPLNPPFVLTNNTTYLLEAETVSGGDWWGNSYSDTDLNPYFASSSQGIYGGNGWGSTPYLGNIGSGSIYTAPNMAVLAPTNPAVFIQPSSIAQLGQTSASLTATLYGAPPVTLQWYQNGAPVPGQTNLTLSFTSLDPTNAGSYYAIVTNSSASATSTVATVTVYTSPVVLGASPQTYGGTMNLFAGASATFSLTSVTGYSPFSYEWFANGVAVNGATSTNYTISNVQSGGPTTFSCVVSNSAGTTTQTWTIAVIAKPTAPYPAAVLRDNPIGYWRLNEAPDNGSGNNGTIANDYWGGNDGVYTNVDLNQTGYSSGLSNQFGYYPATDPTETSAQFGSYPSYPSQSNYVANIQGVNFATSSNGIFSIEAWANGNSGQSYAAAGIVAKGAWGAEQFTLDVGGNSYAYRFTMRNASGSPVYLQDYNQVPDGNWHHLVGVLNQPQSYAAFYVDGVLATNVSVSPSAGVLSSTVPMSIGARQGSGTANYTQQFLGYMNDVAVYNYALSSNQVVNHYLAAGIPPRLLAQPVGSTNVDEGTTLSIPTQVLGTPALSYQWYDITSGSPGTAVTGQSNATFVVHNVSVAAYDGHTLGLTVTNIYGQVTSSSVYVTVQAGPPNTVVITPASPPTLYAGLPITFSVTAQGSAPFTYYWTLDSSPALLAPTDAASYTYTYLAGPHTLACTVSNAEGTASGSVSPSGEAAPTDAYGLRILADQPLAFWRLDEPANSSQANDYVGDHTANYDNQVNGLPGFLLYDTNETATGFGMNGVTSGSLALEYDQSGLGIPNIDFSQQGADPEFSVEAWVNAPPGQPGGAGIVTKGYGSGGEQFDLDVDGGFRFFMRDSLGNTHGPTSSVTPDGGWHHLVGVCDAASASVYLYVDGTLKGSSTMAAGQGVLAPLPEGSPILTSIGSRMSSSSDASYSLQLSNAVVGQVALYNYALSSNQVVAHYSAAAIPATISQQPSPASLELYEGATVQYTATAEGSPLLAYQWYRDGASIAIGTTATLTLANIVPTNSGSYALVVTNAGGAVTSSVVTLTVLTPVAAYDDLIVADAAAFYWRLNETNGTIAYDCISGFNGTYGADTTNGVPGVSDPPFVGFPSNNTAAAMDHAIGTSAGYVTAPALNLNTNTLTITCWVYPFGDITNYQGVFFSRASTYSKGINYVSIAPGRLNTIGYSWNENNEDTWGWDSGQSTPPGQWSFVALTIAPNQAVIYVGANGVLTASTNAIAHDVEAFNGATLIGADTATSDRTFMGAMDAVAVFDYTMTPAQIAQLYSTGALPPNVTLTIQWVGSNLRLTWSQGTLLQAPSVTGPWTTNNASSPYTVTPSGAGMFYRVHVR